jgi:hypothetical protein
MLRRLLPLLGLLACRPAATPPATPTTPGLTPTAFAAQQRAWFDLRKRAAAAMAAEDFKGAADLTREALAASPDHTGLRYTLARALALAGEKDAAFAALDALAGYAQTFPIDQDPALASLQADPRLPALVARFTAAAAPIQTAELRPAATVDIPTFLPECAEPDPRTGDLYLSSVHERRILRVRTDGRRDDLVPPAGHGLWSVLGLRLDPTRNLLWATTTASQTTRDLQKEDAGQSALFAFRLEDGAVAARHLLAEPGVPHDLGDLALLPNGTIIVSDNVAGMLHVLDAPDAALRPLVPAGTFASPQGVVADDTGARLYLADYALGLHALDLTDPAAPTIHPLAAPAHASLRGIDGLDRARRSLVASQNGVAPARVVRIDLDADGLAIDAVTTLAAGLPSFDDPTLVRVVGDQFYVVANSHWNHVDRDGRVPPDADRWSGPLVLAGPHGAPKH